MCDAKQVILRLVLHIGILSIAVSPSKATLLLSVGLRVRGQGAAPVWLLWRLMYASCRVKENDEMVNACVVVHARVYTRIMYINVCGVCVSIIYIYKQCVLYNKVDITI